MKLSVVIPAHNEAENIRATILELLETAKSLKGIVEFRIVVVDDHSTDRTFDVVNGMKDPRVSCIRLSRRAGSHVALRAGMAFVHDSAVLCLSADGQDAPSALPEMIAKMKEGVNIVWALRFNRDNEPLRIRLFAQLFYWVLFMLCKIDTNIDLSRADFFLLDRNVVSAVNVCQERNTSLFGLILWLGFEQSYVEYERRQRRLGSSKWDFKSKARLARDWVIAFSGVPLRLVTLIGGLVSIVGFMLIFYVMFYAIFYSNRVSGWASLMITLLTMGGIQMIMLGVIGEYLWKNLDETRKRPLYFIEKTS